MLRRQGKAALQLVVAGVALVQLRTMLPRYLRRGRLRGRRDWRQVAGVLLLVRGLARVGPLYLVRRHLREDWLQT